MIQLHAIIPEGEARWHCDEEVLPSIRKTGRYSLSQSVQPAADLLTQFEQDVQHRPEQLQEAIQLANARLRYLKLLQKAKPSDGLVLTEIMPTKALTQIGQIAAEDEHTRLTNRVLVFMRKAQEPVSRRTIQWRSHIANVLLGPILDELVASGQVNRIKIPGSRVEWFYQLLGREDEMTVPRQGQPPAC